MAGDPEALTKEPETAAGSGAVDPALPKHGWATEPTMGTPRRSLWSKRTTASGASVGGDEVEGWIPGDFSKSLSGEPRPAERGTPVPTMEPINPSE